jgi:tetratricopeptide (TPR) repeat protein
VYLPVVRHPFISFDDPEYVTENPHVKEGLTWDSFKWAWSSLEHANWHPLTWISHAADVQLFGMAPAGHHLVSLSLHAVNAGLLFLFLAAATQLPGRSFLVSLLFALHPLNVEAVAWVAERKSLLSEFWSLLALVAYTHYARSPEQRKQWFAVTIGLVLLALASKPMAITLPCLFLLLDRWPFERVASWGELFRKRKLWLEKIPLFVLSAGSAIITIVAQQRAHSFSSIAVLSLPLRLENAILSYDAYLLSLVLPTRLSFFYPWPLHPIPAWEILGEFLILVCITALAWRVRLRHAYFLTGWLWFLGTLVPVVGILQVGSQARADRYTYLPMIGFWIAVVWLTAEIVGRGRPYFVGLSLVLSVTFAVVTRGQLDYWRSDYDLWLHAFYVTTDNHLAADKVGVALQKDGRYEDAFSFFNQALRIDGSDPLANFNIGVEHHLRGEMQRAIQFYEVTANQNTDPKLRADAFENMASVYTSLGNLPAARDDYLKTLQFDPQRTRVYAKLRALGL